MAISPIEDLLPGIVYLGLIMIARSEGRIRNRGFTLRSSCQLSSTYNSNMHGLLDIVSLAL